mmetsp:Transcript_24286/g.41759  ORF Transcript_24286/g.41759 Transcript_24286/m.41759 type:complete len:129 (-) Transcript_24286:346-732(-)
MGDSKGAKNGPKKNENETDEKREKRLELNRKAAQESRRRKKLRIEELQRSVIYLTKENDELREQNEVLRKMLTSEMQADNSEVVQRFKAENAALKLALYESVQKATGKKGILDSADGGSLEKGPDNLI